MIPADHPSSFSSTTIPDAPKASPFDHIYGFADLLRYIARKKFHVPPGDVEPLVQDAFVAYLSDPVAVRNTRSYLVGTICNRCRKYWNRRERERTIFHDAVSEVIVDDRAIEDILDRLALDSALSQLPPRCRDVLTKYYRHHESVQSIATEFDTKAAYVHKLLHGCRKRAFEAFRGLAAVRRTP